MSGVGERQVAGGNGRESFRSERVDKYSMIFQGLDKSLLIEADSSLCLYLKEVQPHSLHHTFATDLFILFNACGFPRFGLQRRRPGTVPV